ncbi:Pyruvate, water dikinase [Mycolicibacterium rhodesiae JS60]|nr:Pyruvate, water dikinase [Mycolicibacterium rhodesiae JS60]
MRHIIDFDDPEAGLLDLVGGKGANLGLLTAAGFQVPPGFVVTTNAYADFLRSGGLTEKISGALADLDNNGAEQICAAIRDLLRNAPMPPEIAEVIAQSYRGLGAGTYVAVRSSGTAEDLDGASFAGMHDTYLDTLGETDVIDAVQRCWASLWNERAVTYRHAKGFDHLSVGIAVVVQTMVSSEASGVMFTGNPLTTATDEVVINASWGLGEAVVQGIVSPDQYTLKIGDLRIKEKVIAHKTVQTIRNPETGRGAVETEIPAARQNSAALTDPQIQALGLLGRRVMEYYEGLPQDIEWALAGGELYLLQSRPITGVDFSWDADVDSWQPEIEDDDIIWSRTLSDDMWTGAKTPLFFSYRGEAWSVDYRKSSVPVIGRPELGDMRFIKYYKGEAYTNVEADKIYIQSALPAARPGMALKLPPAMQQDAIDSPFSYLDYLKMLARAKVVYPKTGSPYGWMKALEDYTANRVQEADGLPAEQLTTLSDGELRRYIQQQISLENEYNVDLCWPGLFIYVRDLMTILYLIVDKWYDGDNDYAYPELIAGSPEVTVTVREHLDLHQMAGMIRDSTELTSNFERLGAQAFFDSLETSQDGRNLRERLDAFLAESGHRGHADRDIYFDRYADNPEVVHRALQAHIKSTEDPMIREHANNKRRAEVVEEVEANIRRKPFGGLKVEAFRWVLKYVLDFQIWRDNERHYIDRDTYSVKLGFAEVARRLRERAVLTGERDYYFLTQYELFDLLAGAPATKLTRAKIEARMRNFDAYNTKEWSPPKFLHHDRPMDTAHTSHEGGVLKGLPTSRGTITATARVVKELSQIGRVNKGEILVANSTDPGWTPVFAVISGVIVETGGLLSHSSCLAREYGFPAAQVEGALNLIPDGATITLNGDTGEVFLEEDRPADAVETPDAEEMPTMGLAQVGVGSL